MVQDNPVERHSLWCARLDFGYIRMCEPEDELNLAGTPKG